MIKVGDNVRVITGSNKGKEGKVLKVLRSENKVVINGINLVKKHVKPNRENETGGILETEAPIHISNVKLIDKKQEKVEKKEAKKEVKEAKKATKTTKKEEKKEVKETKTKKASSKKESK